MGHLGAHFGEYRAYKGVTHCRLQSGRRDDRVYVLNGLKRIGKGIYLSKEVRLEDAALVHNTDDNVVVVAFKHSPIRLEEVSFGIILREEILEVVIESEIDSKKDTDDRPNTKGRKHLDGYISPLPFVVHQRN